MARYIDADKLLKNVKDATPMNWTNSEAEIQAQLDWKCCIALIKNQPTADVAEVKHGEWIGEYEETCSECGRSISEILDDGSYYSTEFNIKEFIACPYCGAKIDGGKEE